MFPFGHLKWNVILGLLHDSHGPHTSWQTFSNVLFPLCSFGPYSMVSSTCMIKRIVYGRR
jgi:membrane-associated phospholipid phosphatase